eukprot:PLAT6049.1.p1 GENE.PLAT6049.1~~PLAT6049.1.p1  ORF type:complete len:1230 (-),score=555.27 PLAT6049.1:33-3722(-)
MVLRQLRLVPSGCQGWNTGVVACHGNRFAFCSTLAIYVYNFTDFRLEKLIAGHDRTITGLSWCPGDAKLLATTSMDGRLVVWDVDKEEMLFEHAMPALPTGLAWSPTNDAHIAVTLDNGTIVLVDTEGRGVRDLYSKAGTTVTVLRWSPQEPGVLVAGTDGGVILHIDISARKTNRMSIKGKTSMIMDLRWDVLSNTYLLVAYKNGSISLWDTEHQTELHEFDRQGAGLRSIAWMDWAPGSFVSVNSRTSVIRVWNVSQKQPVEMFKVGRYGFHTISFVPDTDRALCAFADGAVGVYNMTRRKMEFQTNPAHIETIFDIRYKPDSPFILATASYDSHVKVWDTRHMKCLVTLAGQTGVLYSLSWSSAEGDNRLVSVSSKGEAWIWDTERGRKLVAVRHHRGPVYRVHWNPTTGVIASTSGDGQLVIMSDTGELIRAYRHPGPVYGCMWDPFHPTRVATGCHDSRVRVFDTERPGDKPVLTLEGHDARAFNTAWSPLVPNLLASGSDDRTIRIWRVARDESVTLEGHYNNVRALVWHTELPHILLSGSWDATIRVWDIRSRRCLRVIMDHMADVYGLTSHPARPFVFASSSRDTTLRFWNLDGPAIGLRMRGTVEINWSRLCGEVADVMDDASSPPLLCGAESRKLAAACRELRDDVDKLQALSNFFAMAEGMEELWEMVRACVTGRACPKHLQILHARDMVTLTREKATDLSATKKRRMGIGSVRREDELAEAAALYLAIGDMERYCEIQVELGNWEHAMAVAPSVSLDYWRMLASRYAEAKLAKDSADCVPFLIATHSVAPLLRFHSDRGQLHEAQLIAKVDAERGFRKIDAALDAKPAAVEESKMLERGSLEDDSSLRSATQELASHYFRTGLPVMAAAAYLSIGASSAAVQTLLKAHEVELAYAVMRALRMRNVRHVVQRMCDRAEAAGDWKLSARVMEAARDSHTALSLMASRYHAATRSELSDIADDIADADSHLEDAEAAEERGDIPTAVFGFVASRSYARAARLACGKLYKLLSQETWDFPAVLAIMKPLRSIDATVLERADRMLLLAYFSFVGAQQAMWRGYFDVAPFMMQNARRLIFSNSLDFPVAPPLMTLLTAQFLARSDRQRALLLLRSMKGEPSRRVSAAAAALQSRLEAKSVDDDMMDTTAAPSMRNIVVMACSLLPAKTLHKGASLSLLTGRVIRGSEVRLEDDRSAMSVDEVVMWTQVNPFSPLNSGERLMAP